MVFSGFLFPSSGDNCHQARPPRHALLLSDTSCWSHHSDYITWKLPAIAVLNWGFFFSLSSQAKDWMAKKRWSVQFLSNPLSFLRSHVYLAEWNSVRRGALLLFHIYYPCGLSTVEAFICCRGQTGASLAENSLTRGNTWMAPSFPIPVVYADAAVNQLWWSCIYSTYRYALTRIWFLWFIS